MYGIPKNKQELKNRGGRAIVYAKEWRMRHFNVTLISFKAACILKTITKKIGPFFPDPKTIVWF